MRSTRAIAAALAACCLCGPASARDIYVATTGNDGWPGTSAQPYRNIKTACTRAVANDVIHVRAGTYNESWIYVPSNVTVKSEDGLYAAKVYSGGSVAFRFEGSVSARIINAEVDGFEVYSIYAGGGGYYDGLLRALLSDNCRFKNILVHDAPRDADVIKVGGRSGDTIYATTNTLIENCIVYNPSPRNGDLTGASGYQECIDLYPPDGVVVRGCWLYHTPDKKGDVLIFCKGGSKNITWENNIFGPRYGDPYGNAMTAAGGPSPDVYPACENFIARNNLFLCGSADGSFALFGVRNCEFYNNIIWNYNGTRAPIEFYTSLSPNRNENFKFYNNIIYNSNGKGVFSDRGYAPLVFYHDYNIYYQVPSGGDVNIATETHSLFNVDPRLVAPSVPVLGTDTWATIVARFGLQATSPAIDAGLNLGVLVPADLYGVARPMRTAYDIGPYEIPWVGDINKDNHVDAADLLAMAGSWGKHTGDAGFNPACDLNGDGNVDVVDLLMLADNWGR